MKKTLSVEGMSCKHCVMHVKTALEGVPGVSSAEVDLASKSAVVTGELFDDAALKAAVEEAGYSITKIE
jgi:copper chaperone CopZ